jgi:hypothetical protein
MERVEHRDEDDIIELGVATVETKGGALTGEFSGGHNGFELSDL